MGKNWVNGQKSLGIYILINLLHIIFFFGKSKTNEPI